MSNPTHSPASPSADGSHPTWLRRPWKLLAAALLALAIGVLVWDFFHPRTPATSTNAADGRSSGRGGPGGFGGNRALPVAVAAVKTSDFRVFLNALGSVTALNTVTVKSRVDGELVKLHFTEGQRVQAGDLLAEIDPRAYAAVLAQTEGQLARDSALLANAKLDLDRYANAEAAVTQQQLATAKTLVAQYEGAVQADQGVVASARLQLSYCRILAPIDGRVGLRSVDQGNLVKANDATGLVVITQERPIAVIFSLPEDSVPTVRKSLGGDQPLRVTAFDRAFKTVLARGRVAALDNQIDPTTGTVRLKAIFPNEDDALFPNQFVNIRLLAEVQSGALIIPASAVQINGPARFVFVVKGETVERRAIVTGKTEGELTTVDSGLTEGEQVVTDGLDKLQDGAKVALREAGAGSSDTKLGANVERRNKNGEHNPAWSGECKEKRAAPAAP